MAEGSGALARLGDVIYWVCCGVAALSGLGGIILGSIRRWMRVEKTVPPPPPGFILDEPTPSFGQSDYYGFIIAASLVGAAILIWLFGRAVRYVLAGR